MINHLYPIDHANKVSHWYALRTKPRHEKLVRDRLESQGIEQLLPTITRVSQWKDRRKNVELPLFSGYCFARVSKIYWRTLRMVVGVQNIIGCGYFPEPIPDEEIFALKEVMNNDFPFDIHPSLEEGMSVEVVRGPFQGVRGILLGKEKPFKLMVAIRLIQQAVTVEIDGNDVIPLSNLEPR